MWQRIPVTLHTNTGAHMLNSNEIERIYSMYRLTHSRIYRNILFFRWVHHHRHHQHEPNHQQTYRAVDSDAVVMLRLCALLMNEAYIVSCARPLGTSRLYGRPDTHQRIFNIFACHNVIRNTYTQTPWKALSFTLLWFCVLFVSHSGLFFFFSHTQTECMIFRRRARDRNATHANSETVQFVCSLLQPLFACAHGSPWFYVTSRVSRFGIYRWVRPTAGIKIHGQYR